MSRTLASFPVGLWWSADFDRSLRHETFAWARRPSGESSCSRGTSLAPPATWKQRDVLEANPMMPGDVLVVSPHCDDAVFSCGDLIAHPRASVVTIFAGHLPSGSDLTPWDASSGFMPRRRHRSPPDGGLVGADAARCEAALARLPRRPVRATQDGGDRAHRRRAGRGWPRRSSSRSASSIRPDLRIAAIPSRPRDRPHDPLVRGRDLSAGAGARRHAAPTAERRRILARRATPARAGAASACKRWAVRCYGSQLRAAVRAARHRRRVP